MANDYFQFRQFVVRQKGCAMKVGTDGTLLGSWAQAPAGGCRILDVGTGTGLIALMMAQRFPEAHVTGIDIDADAVDQAAENALESPFKDRVTIRLCDVVSLEDALCHRLQSALFRPLPDLSGPATYRSPPYS